MPVNKSGQFYRDYDIDLSKAQKSKGPVKDVPTPNVHGSTDKGSRGDLGKEGQTQVIPKTQSTESPMRVKGNLDRMGREDCAGMNEKEPDNDYDD